MKIEFDLKEFYDFADALEDHHDFESAIMTATQKIARVLHSEILQRTPVDTGNLRKMWSAGDNLLFTVDKAAGGYVVTLINEAKNAKNGYFMYGVAVEDGYRTKTGGFVEGQFFVRNSIYATMDELKTLVYPELHKWFARCFNGK